MTAEDIKAYCLSKHKACEAYPFGKVPVCYKLNDKIFAQLYPDEGNYKITLKCTADAAQFYRMVYPDKIMEGYHCSKVQKPYWNTIYLDDFPEKELYNMIDFAYDTVLHGFSKKVQKQILEEAGKQYLLLTVPTALKHSMLTGDVILRFCNLSDEETTVTVSQPEIFTYDLLEKDRLQKEENEIVLGKHEIRTIGWRA